MLLSNCKSLIVASSNSEDGTHQIKQKLDGSSETMFHLEMSTGWAVDGLKGFDLGGASTKNVLCISREQI